MQEFSQVSEAIRASIARYTHALDDGRTDDVVALYTPEGTFDMPGMGTFTGTDALRQAYTGWKPTRPQRHLVLNTLVTDVDEQEAHAVSDVVFLFQGKDGWSVQFVARYHDTLHLVDGRWLFHHRAVMPVGGGS